jgi:hypothetical protein
MLIPLKKNNSIIGSDCKPLISVQLNLIYVSKIVSTTLADITLGSTKSCHCGSTMRIIALIDGAGVIERTLKHLSVWDPQPEIPSPAGPDPPWPRGETIPLTCHPPPDVA